MKAKIYILPLLVLVLYGCKKEQALEEQIDNVVVVNAFLEIDQPIAGIKLTGLDRLDGNPTGVQDDLYCEIVQGDNVYPLTRDEQGSYNYNDESVLVLADTGYELKVTGKDKVIRSYTVTPKYAENLTLTKLTINTQLAFDQIDVEFFEPEGVDVFYLVKIELEDKLSTDPILFPIQDVANPTRAFLYNGNLSTIPLLASYFEFYGTHIVTVERIDEIYYDLYQDKFNQDFFLDGGNITNGKGIFIGKEKFSFVVDVI